jgi:hypothetical protein
MFFGGTFINYGWSSIDIQKANKFILINKHYDGLMKSGKIERQ